MAAGVGTSCITGVLIRIDLGFGVEGGYGSDVTGSDSDGITDDRVVLSAFLEAHPRPFFSLFRYILRFGRNQ